MTVNNANTSMTADGPLSQQPDTETLGEGEFFLTDKESGTRKFYRIGKFDKITKKSTPPMPEKKKKKKKANGPKKPQTAYFLFMNKMRPTIQAELEKTGIKGKELVTSIAKMAGQQWKALPEDQKKEFNDLHTLNKQKYDEEIKTMQTDEGIKE